MNKNVLYIVATLLLSFYSANAGNPEESDQKQRTSWHVRANLWRIEGLSEYEIREKIGLRSGVTFSVASNTDFSLFTYLKKMYDIITSHHDEAVKNRALVNPLLLQKDLNNELVSYVDSATIYNFRSLAVPLMLRLYSSASKSTCIFFGGRAGVAWGHTVTVDNKQRGNIPPFKFLCMDYGVERKFFDSIIVGLKFSSLLKSSNSDLAAMLNSSPSIMLRYEIVI